MEISQLVAFVRVANEGSLTRAADVLGITQPAVTSRIQALEADIKGKLFERHGRNLHLTPLGRYFLPYAQRIISLSQEAHLIARYHQQGIMGQVRIAAPTPFLISFLMPTLLQFRLTHPNVDIVIRERHKATILELLQDNVIILGLVNAPVFDDTFEVLTTLKDAIIPVVSSRHWLAQKQTPLTMTDIIAHPILRVSLFPRMTAFMDELAEQSRHASGGAVVSLPMVLAYELAIMGQGVTFLPQTYVQKALHNAQLVHLTIQDMPALYSEAVLIKMRHRTLDDAHQQFITILQHLNLNH